MTNDSSRKEEQPGLEVVPQAKPDKVTLPETNYVENEASPPPQEFQISHSTTHPLFRPSSLYDGPGSGGAQFAHMYAKELGTDSKTTGSMTMSPYMDSGLSSPTATMMYPPNESSADLEENRRVFLPVQEISHSQGAAAERNVAQVAEFMKRVPLWRRRKCWIIVGIILGVFLVIGCIVGGVLASQED
ncbi:hypothetical protein V8F20_003175 [Naviculisporaceae sp. PSN 640]